MQTPVLLAPFDANLHPHVVVWQELAIATTEVGLRDVIKCPACYCSACLPAYPNFRGQLTLECIPHARTDGLAVFTSLSRLVSVSQHFNAHHRQSQAHIVEGRCNGTDNPATRRGLIKSK